MKRRFYLVLTSVFLLSLFSHSTVIAQTTNAKSDPYLWLEEVESERALAWVNEHDKTTHDRFMNDAEFEAIQEKALELLSAKDRIPSGEVHGNYVYNFWQDDKHIRGILRRTILDEYKKENPIWETLLDIDSLNKAEGKSWVYKESIGLPPNYTRCMIKLSPGGTDASAYREYDYNTKQFIEGGFVLPVATSSVSWFDENTLIVGTNFGEGSLTKSGYPRISKLWKRGTNLKDAVTIGEGDISDVGIFGSTYFGADENLNCLIRYTSFWETEKSIFDENLEQTKLSIPNDADLKGYIKGQFIIYLNSAWLEFPEGSLLALSKEDIGSAELGSKSQVIYKPDEKSTVEEVYLTKDYVIVSILHNVVGKLRYYEPSITDGKTIWADGEIDLPDNGSVGVTSSSAFDNTLLISFKSFLSPQKLFLTTDAKEAPVEIKSLPDKFDASGHEVTQRYATSKDGTQIPYFVIAPKGAKLDGSNPTLLYGYGGFRSSSTPFYSYTIGNFWLAKGGVFVLANIRGGGEFGPAWHKAALLENRQRSYDDFIAVAEDLIEWKISSPSHLGIMGGSNGGLLVGVAFTQRPDLFNAVVCQVPLLDMIRYTKLPPGASWMGEYGDPDIPEQRAYIEKYSPYQNLKKGTKYPEVLFVTSTKDDRVHPGHARKMAARMEEYGNAVHFYEETEGGHGAAADNVQRARRYALEYNYLHKMLSK